MKIKITFFVLFLFQVSFSQNVLSEDKKTEKLIHIWGLLKYCHPEVSRGTFDFDTEFIKEFEKMERITSQEEFDNELLSWINKFDLKKSKFKNNENYLKQDNLFSKNANFGWIENSNFSEPLMKHLNEINTNVSYKDYYASVNYLSGGINFKNDKPLVGFDANNKSHRILFLASFWNKMNYWNVNIYLTKIPWNQVLTAVISEFISDDSEKFEVAKEKLFSKLNDSHSDYSYSHTLKELVNFPGFGGRIVNDSLVVTNIYDEKVSKEDGVSIGDIIFSIEGKSIKEYYDSKFSDVISVSTENYLKRAIEKSYLLASVNDSISVAVLKKNGIVYDMFISLKKLNYYAERYTRMRPEKTENWKLITNEIGYLNLDYSEEKDLKEAFFQFKNTKGIIIDLRNYPHHISGSDLAKYLYPKKKVFVKIVAALMPSYGEYDAQSSLKVIKNPFAEGSNNAAFYKGKIVLLVDRSTASFAEFLGMMIQQSPNCFTMGEQTFGAVMNRNQVPLTDNTKIDFTGAGAFYPNDESVQGKGLRIDYEIKETAKNFNKNLYVEQAVKLIQN